MKVTTVVILFAVLIGVVNNKSWGSVDLGVYGKVYEINEPDWLKEVLKKAKLAEENGILEEKINEKKEAIKRYLKRPKGVDLEFAKENSHRLFDPTYTLERDIANEYGEVIYPAGYTFNPLNYMTWNKRLCLINGDREAEVEWAYKSCQNVVKDRIILTKGCFSCVQEKFDQKIYFDQYQMIIKKFNIKKTPSAISQFKKMILIKEFYVE